MNQILYTGGKNKKGSSIDLQKIIIFFVILIIIFAICAIAVGINLLGKVKNPDIGNENTVGNITETPVVESNIEVEFESKVGAVKAVVASKLKINTLSFWWDDEEPITKEINNTTYEIEIPSKQGTHTLKMKITDENGYVKELSQRVIGDTGPELTISTDRVSNYVITAKDDEKINRIVIILNGETQEIEVNDKEFQYKVAIPQGDSLIDVTVYNLNELSTNKKAKIKNFGG